MTGPRPTATRQTSALTACADPAASKATSTPSSASRTSLTEAPACAAMPRLRNARAISLETSSSSSGASLGRASTSVTSAPIER